MECEKTFQALLEIIGEEYWKFAQAWKKEFPGSQVQLLTEMHRLFQKLSLYDLHRIWKNA